MYSIHYAAYSIHYRLYAIHRKFCTYIWVYIYIYMYLFVFRCVYIYIYICICSGIFKLAYTYIISAADPNSDGIAQLLAKCRRVKQPSGR